MNMSTQGQQPACQITGMASAGARMHSLDVSALMSGPARCRMRRHGLPQPFSKTTPTTAVAQRIEGGCGVA